MEYRNWNVYTAMFQIMLIFNSGSNPEVIEIPTAMKQLSKIPERFCRNFGRL